MNQTQIWQKAIDIYADIAEMTPAQALTQLKDYANLSYEIKQAVITLINSGNQASQYIEDNFTPRDPSLDFAHPHYEIGSLLGEYELIEKIGQGGMSQVFKAQRVTDQAQKQVAIKIFSPQFYSQSLLEHFINEQKILADLSHSAIVDMHHGGQTKEGTTYLVMELIDKALPINTYCKQHSLSKKEIIHYITQCADALAYSHANLIIHRDLKPDNILINQEKNLKIVDFGIAKLINKNREDSKTTLMALTPSYAAPEQINSAPVSVKTDVFSLAVVALELLLGKQFLPKDRLIKSCENDESAIEKALKQAHIDKDLKNILRKAMHQEADQRYASMQSFADDLYSYLADKPVSATSPSFFYRIQKFAKRRTTLFITLLSLLFSLIIGFAITLWQYQQIKIEAIKAEKVKQFMIDSFAVTDPNNSKGIRISATDLLDLSYNKLQSDRQIEDENKIDLLQALSSAYGKLGRYDKAITLLGHSLKLDANNSQSQALMAEFMLNADKLAPLETLLNSIEYAHLSLNDKMKVLRVKTKILILKSQFDEAESLFKELEQLNKTTGDLNQKTLNTLYSQRLRAEFFSSQSKNKLAIETLTTLINNTQLDENNTLIIAIKADLAELYDEVGDANLSIKYWQEVVDIQREILGNRHPSLALSLSGLSAAYRHVGEIDKALNSIKQAYKLSLELNGKDNLTTANILNTHAMLLFDKGETETAIKYLFEVVEIYQSSPSKDYLDTYILKTNLATILSQVGRTQESYEMIKEVYQHNLQAVGKNHYDTLSAQQLLARNLSTLGLQQQAIEMAKNAVENAQTYIDEDSKNDILFGTYYTLGKIYQDHHDYQLSLDSFLQVLNKDMLNPDDIKYAILIHAIAKVYHQLGDFEQAQKYYLKSINRFEQIFGYTHPRVLSAKIKYAQLLKDHQKKEQLHSYIEELQDFIRKNDVQDKQFLEFFAQLEK